VVVIKEIGMMSWGRELKVGGSVEIGGRVSIMINEIEG
jgi:hypothetical protein